MRFWKADREVLASIAVGLAIGTLVLWGKIWGWW